MALSQLTPGASVTIVNPPVVLSGVPVNTAGVVGTASLGPVNVPVPVNGSSYTSVFGPVLNRKHDMGTIVATASLNGASTIYCVRVTDGTDTVATVNINNAVVNSIYTGSGYNGATITFTSGQNVANSNSININVTVPGHTPEVFRNVPASNASVFWSYFQQVINTGWRLRAPSSQFLNCVSITNAVTLPTNGQVATLAGGTDGWNVRTADMLGSSAAPMTGMYALSSDEIQYAVLADLDDSASWTTQSAYGESTNTLMIGVCPASTLSANAIATKASVGLDSDEMVLLAGDWCYWYDTTNEVTRLVSPQGFYLGARARLTPNLSVLNKPMSGIVSTQRLKSGAPYSSAETDSLDQAGIELVTNPIQMGSVFGCLLGVNTSSVLEQSTDAWSTMTNWLARTFLLAGGPYVGQPNDVNTWNAVTSSFNNFLSGLVSGGVLSLQPNGSLPYKVTCDASNNSLTSVAIGYVNVFIQVQYQGVVRYFNVSLQGGAGVQISQVNQ